MKLPISSVVSLCRDAGFTGSDLPIAVAVARAESSFETSIIGDSSLMNWKWGPSVGLFQIRSLRFPWYWPPPDNLRVKRKLLDAAYNCSTAKAIHERSGWNPWSTYKSGAYLDYLGAAQAACGEGAGVA